MAITDVARVSTSHYNTHDMLGHMQVSHNQNILRYVNLKLKNVKQIENICGP